jgi:fatty-acyl-CoA synthase
VTGLGWPVTDWVDFHARHRPDSVALDGLDSGLRLTWDALGARVARLAGALTGRLGIRAGERVAVVADDDPRVIELQFACNRIGAVFVPFNWRLAPVEIESLCRDAEPSVIVHDDSWQELAVGLRDRLAIPRIASWGCPDTELDLDQARDTSGPVAARRDHTSGQVSQVLYTSGTTGTPKGAMIPLGSLIANTMNVVDGLSLAGPPARYLSALPLFHAAGLNVMANPVLMTGGRMSIVRRFEPERVARLLGDPANGYTHFNAAPAMYQMMAEHLEGRDFSALRASMAGGSRLEPELSDRLAELGIVAQTAWGGTEMGPNLTLTPRRDRAGKVEAVGLPVRYTELRVVDPVTGRDVPRGQAGEAWCRGPSVCAGYWRRDSPFEDGWFRSGDAVRIDDDGFVVLSGRFKDMYKSGGENVFAAEVEAILIGHPAVAEVAVIGVPDPKWGEVGRAVVVPVTGGSIGLAELVEHCTGRLARYKIPKSVVTVGALPRNVLGKVTKDVVRRDHG